MQETTELNGSTTEFDSHYLAETAFRESQMIVKVIQINAATSQRTMHEIEGLLSSNSIDVCLIQEAAIDSKGIYLFDRRPYRLVLSSVKKWPYLQFDISA